MISKQVDMALRVAEKQAERDLGSRLSARMEASAKDMGDVDGLRQVILGKVMGEHYANAIEALDEYLVSKPEYPQFKIRAERYYGHCVDLINAIKSKRSFPGIQYLSLSKQQELLDRSMQHFEELKLTLKKVEQLERQVRLEDLRSTIWVVRAVVYSVFGILVIAFLLELSRGLLPSLYVVCDDVFGRLVNALFDKIGF